jgi:hypothetical protein
MPVLVNTALTEGIDSRWGVKEVEPEDVADQIVDALERARVDVFVPRSLHTTLSLGNLLPRRAREAVSRWMGVDKVIIDADPRSRRAYEERAAKSRAEATESEPAESEPAGR